MPVVQCNLEMTNQKFDNAQLNDTIHTRKIIPERDFLVQFPNIGLVIQRGIVSSSLETLPNGTGAARDECLEEVFTFF